MSWDKELAAKLRDQGLTQEQAGFVLGIVAEERQRADIIGYCKGINQNPDAKKFVELAKTLRNMGDEIEKEGDEAYQYAALAYECAASSIEKVLAE